MNSILNITTLQLDLAWEQATLNRQKIDQIISQVQEETDLFVLPEMFSTGFSMNPSSIAESMDGETISWMKDVAKRTNSAITGSVIIQEKGAYFNRLLFVHPDGTVDQYDKRHLFTLSGEHKSYKAGIHRSIIDYRGWKICPMVCYDLRFPVWSRNTENYDLLLYVANWPVSRIEHWRALLKARAIENQCFVAGVNRIGTDQNGYEFNGFTSVIDYSGNLLYECEGKEESNSVTLHKQEMMKFRQVLDFLPDRDDFSINV